MNNRALWKAGIRRALRLFGVEIFNDGDVVRFFAAERRPWGLEPAHDIARLLGAERIETIVDVGANEGQTSGAWAEAFPRATFFACEPASEPYSKLLALSRRLQRIRPSQVAISDTAGEAEFHTNLYSTLGSLLAIDPAFPYGRQQGTERVKTERLDAFVQQHGIGTIDVLKVDTQGSELRVFEGAGALLSSGRIQAILCELNFESIYPGQASPATIYSFLEAAGFRLVCFYRMATNPQGLASWTDALFAHSGLSPEK